MSCEHKDFLADVQVGRITDSQTGEITQFVADVTVKCSECGEPFGFRGAPGGHSWNEPRCQVDALKISLPLMSPHELALAGPLPVFGRGPMVYEVVPSQGQQTYTREQRPSYAGNVPKELREAADWLERVVPAEGRDPDLADLLRLLSDDPALRHLDRDALGPARYTREQLLSDEALQALYEHFGIPFPELPKPAPPVERRLREGMEAVADAIDKGKGGEDG